MSDVRQQALDAFMDQQNAPAPDAAPDPRRQALDAFMAQRRDNALEADVAGFTETELSRPRIRYEAPKTEDSWLNWGARAVRSASFGLPDLLSARIIQEQMRDRSEEHTSELQSQ